MSFNFSSERKRLTTFSLSGLADIVLLLLIFFLLTSSFIPQFGIQVNLPEANAAATTQSQHITVAITDKGQYYVEQELVPKDGLLQAIQSRLGTSGSTVQNALVIRADRDATYEQFVTVANIGKALNLRVLGATDRIATR